MAEWDEWKKKRRGEVGLRDGEEAMEDLSSRLAEQLLLYFGQLEVFGLTMDERIV